MQDQAADCGDAPFHPDIAPAALTAGIDVYGNPLEVGCRVRSFSSPFAFGDGRIAGLEMTGERVGYMEGVLTAIGEVEHEGCPRYSIEVESRVSGRGGDIRVEPLAEDSPWKRIIPPLNGTPTSMGGRTFGVVRVVE